MVVTRSLDWEVLLKHTWKLCTTKRSLTPARNPAARKLLDRRVVFSNISFLHIPLLESQKIKPTGNIYSIENPTGRLGCSFIATYFFADGFARVEQFPMHCLSASNVLWRPTSPWRSLLITSQARVNICSWVFTGRGEYLYNLFSHSSSQGSLSSFKSRNCLVISFAKETCFLCHTTVVSAMRPPKPTLEWVDEAQKFCAWGQGSLSFILSGKTPR